MKSLVTIFVALLGIAAPVLAQLPANFPECGTFCITSMLGKASELGCSSTDIKCLCTNQNFGYGIRDCSYQSCHDDAAAAQIVSFGVSFCASNGVTIPIETAPPAPTGTGSAGGGSGSGGNGSGGSSAGGSSAGGSSAGGSGGGSGGATGGAGGAGGAGSSVPVTTSAIVSVFTSAGTAVTTTIGSTTLFSVVGGGAGTGGAGGGSAGSVPISTSSFTTVITSGGSTFTSTGASTIFGTPTAVKTSQVVSTIVSGSSTFLSTGLTTISTTSTRSTSTSSGFAPQMTAAPVGLLAAAGLAALLL